MHANRQSMGVEDVFRSEKRNSGLSNADLLDLQIVTDGNMDNPTKGQLFDVWGASYDGEYSSFNSRCASDAWTPFQIKNSSKQNSSRNNSHSFNNNSFKSLPCRPHSPTAVSGYSDSGYGSQVGGNTPTPSLMSLSSQEESMSGFPIDLEKYSFYMNLIPDVNRMINDFGGNRITCKLCPWTGKTQSQKRKHDAAHLKGYKCEEDGCGKGFGTQNDLERHRKTVHSKNPRRGPTEKYKCFGKTCTQSDKLWPRLDNFKAHLRRKHGDENEEYLLNLSRAWYEKWKKEEAELSSLRRQDTDEAVHTITPSKTLNNPESYFSISPENLRVMDEQVSDKSATVPAETATEPTFIQRPGKEESSSKIIIPTTPSNVKLPGFQTLIQSTISEEGSIPRESTPEQGILPNVHAFDRGVALLQVLTLAALQGNQKQEPCCDTGAKEKITCVEQADYPSQIISATKFQTSEEELPNIDQFSNEEKEFCLKMISKMHSQLTLQAPESSTSNASTRDIISQKKFVRHAGGRGEPRQEGFSCSKCQKVFARQSTLNKHLKRHERPYGCTFAGCYSTFGSKADWKRHESMQHYHAQCFRCSLPRGKHDQCALLFVNKEEFVKHLTEHEHTSYVSKDKIPEEVEKSRIGAYDHQSRFYYWCGFCRQIKLVEKKGVDALNERFDHIGEHFQNEKNINEWFPAKGHTMKGARKKREKSKMKGKHAPKKLGKRPLGDEEGVDQANNSHEDAEHINYEACPSSEDDTDSEAKQLFTNYYDQKIKLRKVDVCSRWEAAVYCCSCYDGPYNIVVIGSCMNCNHLLCPFCHRD